MSNLTWSGIKKDKRVSVPVPQSKSKGATKAPLYMAIAFLVEGYLAKSFIFKGNDPTMLHYAVSTGISLLIGIAFCLRGEVYRGRYDFLFLCMMAVFWSFLGSYASGVSLNYVSASMFGMMVFSCYFWFPFVCSLAQKETWRLILAVLAIPVLLSPLMMVATPDLAYDPGSGRFQGAFISVAVACNVYFYVAVFAAFAAKTADTKGRARERNIYLLICVISLLLLYLTRTRSLLVNALLCIGVAAVTTKEGRLIFPRMMGAGIIAATIIAGGLIAGMVSGFDFESEFVEFRLDRNLTSSRDENWAFGIERIQNEPIFGEGLLTKQSKGGKGDINLEGGNANYSSTYDPHSLVLSLGVQGGIPFMIAVMAIVLGTQIAYLRAVGLSQALASPEFVITALNTLVMIPGGGDLTSFGNLIDRIFWMLLGSLGLQAAQTHRNKSVVLASAPAAAAASSAGRVTAPAPAAKMKWGAGD